MTENFEERLLEGLAGVLVAEATVNLAWSPTEPYAAGEVGIYLSLYPEIPEDSVTIASYPVSDDPASSDSVVGVQVTTRASDTDRLGEISGAIYDVLQGRWGGMLGAIRLVMSSRASGTNVGQDSNDRLGRIENYYLTVHRPSPHRS